jgi:hypothetical protein
MRSAEIILKSLNGRRDNGLKFERSSFVIWELFESGVFWRVQMGDGGSGIKEMEGEGRITFWA